MTVVSPQRDVLVVRGNGPVDTKSERCQRWCHRQKTSVFLCLFSLYIILRIGLAIIDYSQNKDINLFHLETRAKKLAIVVPFRTTEIDHLYRVVRYHWRASSLHCLPFPSVSASDPSLSLDLLEGYRCGEISLEMEGVVTGAVVNVIEEHFNLRGCDSSKGYGYFIDLIFYLDGRYEELPYAKAIIEEAIGNNPMLRGCFETLVFLSADKDSGASVSSPIFEKNQEENENEPIPNLNDIEVKENSNLQEIPIVTTTTTNTRRDEIEAKIAEKKKRKEKSQEQQMDFMFLKLLYLFKLSEMEYNTYDYFFWMPLDVQPIRSFWIDGIYEQVLTSDQHYFWVKGSNVIPACLVPSSSSPLPMEEAEKEKKPEQHSAPMESRQKRKKFSFHHSFPHHEKSSTHTTPSFEEQEKQQTQKTFWDRFMWNVDERKCVLSFCSHEVSFSSSFWDSSYVTSHSSLSLNTIIATNMQQHQLQHQHQQEKKKSLPQNPSLPDNEVRPPPPLPDNNDNPPSTLSSTSSSSSSPTIPTAPAHINLAALYRLNDPTFDSLVTMNLAHLLNTPHHSPHLFPNNHQNKREDSSSLDQILFNLFSQPVHLMEKLHFYVYSPFIQILSVETIAPECSSSNHSHADVGRSSSSSEFLPMSRAHDFPASTYLIRFQN